MFGLWWWLSKNSKNLCQLVTMDLLRNVINTYRPRCEFGCGHECLGNLAKDCLKYVIILCSLMCMFNAHGITEKVIEDMSQGR